VEWSGRVEWACLELSLVGWPLGGWGVGRWAATGSCVELADCG
jgi:hypothetical protein